jgi:hypothetical protein
MTRVIDLGRGALLDIASYGRRGPGQRRALQSAEIAQMVRTARGAPEVVVKVSGGATSIRGVGTHLDYIGREGEQEIETDKDGVSASLDSSGRSSRAGTSISSNTKAPSSAQSLRVASHRSSFTT